jgi:hypothetical protein
MRVATVCALAISMSLAAGVAFAQNDPVKALAVAAATAAPVATEATCPGNPNPLGVARVVEIDTTGGPGFGFQHFRAYDFLREGEVVLTFDDGPWPGNTPAVLKALAAQCTKALFFPIGKHAMWHPEILKGTSNNDYFVVGSTAPAARRSFPLLIWRGCVSAFCGRCPVQGPSAGLLRYAAATIRSSVTSRRML